MPTKQSIKIKEIRDRLQKELNNPFAHPQKSTIYNLLINIKNANQQASDSK